MNILIRFNVNFACGFGELVCTKALRIIGATDTEKKILNVSKQEFSKFILAKVDSIIST
jgi:hypothetical protein